MCMCPILNVMGFAGQLLSRTKRTNEPHIILAAVSPPSLPPAHLTLVDTLHFQRCRISANRRYSTNRT
ncbi:unnamed protein product [Brugia pahangi]|uniref:Secreted protein n=1 Tax=Brugia pahangi TaxID=6280 RepID=A0A0N4TN60_BRUPA|nr:unnamed protein product [Brugia pahangi]